MKYVPNISIASNISYLKKRFEITDTWVSWNAIIKVYCSVFTWRIFFFFNLFIIYGLNLFTKLSHALNTRNKIKFFTMLLSVERIYNWQFYSKL